MRWNYSVASCAKFVYEEYICKTDLLLGNRTEEGKGRRSLLGLGMILVIDSYAFVYLMWQ